MRHRHRWTRWTAMASGNRYRACRDWACGEVEAVVPEGRPAPDNSWISMEEIPRRANDTRELANASADQ